MELEFNDYGNLEGGIVKITDLKEVETFLVDDFPESNTICAFNGLHFPRERFVRLFAI